MLSLKERIELLERDLLTDPPRIIVMSSLPFAILRYDPEDEWALRREMRLLAQRLGNAGKRVHFISLAELLWQSVEESEGLEVVIQLERDSGFEAAQRQVGDYLSDPDWRSLPDLLTERLADLEPQHDLVFLWRAAAMAPAIYQMSRLLDQMQHRTQAPTVLFYPGSLEGTTGLRFMNIPDRQAMGNYRVKIYG
jgi:hypothetical protein